MIRLKLDIEYFFIMWKINRGNDDRPYVTNNSYAIYLLKKQYHDWLKENNIQYELDKNSTKDYDFCIVFENKADAVLFKLFWM